MERLLEGIKAFCPMFMVISTFLVIGGKQLKYRIRCNGLPLASYREVAAHLSQVEGVQIELILQQSQQFDYTLSQIDSIWIEYPNDAASGTEQQVRQILAYYGDRYGAWENVNS